MATVKSKTAAKTKTKKVTTKAKVAKTAKAIKAKEAPKAQEPTCPIALATLWAEQATAALESNPEAHPMSVYRRTEAQLSVMANALVKASKNGKNNVPMQEIESLCFNPKVKHQSFWGSGKDCSGARPVGAQLNGLGWKAIVAREIVCEDGRRSSAYSISLEKGKPFGRYAPTK